MQDLDTIRQSILSRGEPISDEDQRTLKGLSVLEVKENQTLTEFNKLINLYRLLYDPANHTPANTGTQNQTNQ